MRKGAIILCGGKSKRMGRDKAKLPFGPELMLPRVVRLVAEAVGRRNIVVVAAIGQTIASGLPVEVVIARDGEAGRGPLEGLAAGLRVLAERSGDAAVDAAYATACDVPLLVPAFVDRMFELLEEFEIAVPVEGDRHHPLAAVYRPRVLAHVEHALEAGHRQLRSLFGEVSTREVPVDVLRQVDPLLATLANVNTEQDYAVALAAAEAEVRSQAI